MVFTMYFCLYNEPVDVTSVNLFDQSLFFHYLDTRKCVYKYLNLSVNSSDFNMHAYHTLAESRVFSKETGNL